MGEILLRGERQESFTCIPNLFIDNYIAQANGEYVKVYLYLLRCMNKTDTSLSVSGLADKLELTEADILRALRYWEKAGLLQLDFYPDQSLKGIMLLDVYQPKTSRDVSLEEPREKTSTPALKDQIPSESAFTDQDEKPQYSLEQIEKFQTDESVQEILFITENYLGRTLTSTDMQMLLYWYDVLGFSSDLIEYLIETCISSGHTSLRYMEKVAISWSKQNIKTIEEAKASQQLHSKSTYEIKNAFGITGRNLVASEQRYAKKWVNDYGFSKEIIDEACRRTIAATGKSSFEYADRILENWHKSQVHTLQDIVRADSTFQKAKQTARNEAQTQRACAPRFNNFTQRSYNFDQLEGQLLQTASSTRE